MTSMVAFSNAQQRRTFRAAGEHFAVSEWSHFEGVESLRDAFHDVQSHARAIGCQFRASNGAAKQDEQYCKSADRGLEFHMPLHAG